MTLENLNKEGKIKVVVDDKKHLMKLCIGKEETTPMFTKDKFFRYSFINFAHKNISVLCLDGKTVRVEILGVDNEVINIDATKGDIEYNKTIAKGSIDKVLYDYYRVQDRLVEEIITFFKLNDVVFKHPCIIENPDDTLVGGIKIQSIQGGVVIEYEEEGHNSWDITELDDWSIVKLYRWYDIYQY